jgi:hypothetical protein
MAKGVAMLQPTRPDCANDIKKNDAARVTGVLGAGGAAARRAGAWRLFACSPRSPQSRFRGHARRGHQDDLSFPSFPWFLVGAFVVFLGVGIALMLFRPIAVRRLAADTVRLAKGEIERLGEDQHPGKFGSIARSVNIHIDKLGRDAKSAKKDLDQLLGPAPEGSIGTIDLLATALPAIRPGGPAPAVPVPPSEFRFGDSGSMPARPATPPPRAATPPPVRAQTPLPGAISRPGAGPAHHDLLGGLEKSPQIDAPSAPLTLDDDILGGSKMPTPPATAPEASSPRVDPYFKQVYDQFIAVKKSCNEPTAGLTYEKFSEKLVKNRDDLISKTGCREVRFTVYIKEGKAALKATPVKEDEADPSLPRDLRDNALGGAANLMVSGSARRGTLRLIGSYASA